ncbi:ice-binding family protein [Flavobacterium sp. 123]|uniref:ice-binding family protein n=1 Tax=Flavobacterium sp. 123 TaxID=2135627 RepID=UPI0013147657|nr:ice-binding family protein [Flavobacterium sp. 123]
MMHINSFSKTFFYIALLWFFTNDISAQIVQKIGDNSNSINDNAVLEIESTTKGFLLPRMTKVQRDLINNPSEGLMLWCSDCSLSSGSEIVVWVKNSWTGLLISNLAEKNILLGNAYGKATAVTLSGDVTIDNAGVSTIGTNKVISSMINDGTIITADISNNAVITSKISDANVTYSKIQNVMSNTILGRTTSGEGSVEEIATTGNSKVVLSDSPTLSGLAMAPTASPSTNTEQIATTAFVLANSDKYYSVNSSEEITTRATSDEVVPGMSLVSGLGGTYFVTFNAQYNIDPSDRTSQAATDVLTVYNNLIALTSSAVTIDAVIATRTFTPGIYTDGASAGTVAAGVIITLDGAGTYIFKFGAALSMGADVKIILTNGATSSNVFWIAEGAIAIGANANIKGSLISNSGAVDLAAGCFLEGKLLAIKSGAISISTSNVTNSGSSSVINWDLISSFAIFSNGGVVSNTGSSTIYGDIGTKTGSITIASFDESIVSGNFYTSLLGSALASFSLYQNGALIANSTRMRSSTINTVDISLQAIATVALGQNIDVRWSCDSGKITLKNRILTLVKVR